MKISISADEKRHAVDAVIEYLHENGHKVSWCGPEQGSALRWPEVARQVSEKVVSQKADCGILFCWTGTGVSIAANKMPGIRAALCGDAETARGARLWNNANVLCLSLRATTDIMALEIVESWINTTYLPNAEDDACLALLEGMEK